MYKKFRFKKFKKKKIIRIIIFILLNFYLRF